VHQYAGNEDGMTTIATNIGSFLWMMGVIESDKPFPAIRFNGRKVRAKSMRSGIIQLDYGFFNERIYRPLRNSSPPQTAETPLSRGENSFLFDLRKTGSDCHAAAFSLQGRHDDFKQPSPPSSDARAAVSGLLPRTQYPGTDDPAQCSSLRAPDD
jgi:hypothetical protein